MTDRSTPWTLPPRPALFVDRAEELAEVRGLHARAVATGSPLRLVIYGAPGAGKSTLLVRLGYELADSYPAGAIYADLRGNDPQLLTGPEGLAAGLLAQLGMPWRDIPERPEFLFPALRNTLARQRILLLIDDVGSAGQVEPLLGDMSNAAVVVTARSRLRRLERAGFDSITLRGFDEQYSLELLTAIAGHAVAGVSREVLGAFHTLADGLPLILTINGAHLGDGELADEYLSRLAGDTAVDELELDDVRLYQLNCDAVYHGLDAAEQLAYRQLALIPGPHFDGEVAAEVLGLASAEVRRLIRRLLDRHLLSERGPGRYGFHHYLRSHAIGCARRADTAQELRNAEVRAVWQLMRHAVALDKTISERPIPSTVAGFHYLVAEPAFTGPSATSRASAEFDWDRPCFLAAALRAAELGEHQPAVVLPVALWTFGYRTGRVGDLIDLYQRAVEFAEGPETRWLLLRDLAALYEKIGEPATARRYQELAAGIDYPPGTASTLEWRALIAESEGRLDEAEDLLRRAAQAVALIGDPFHETRSHALIMMHLGRIRTARRRWDEAEPGLVAAHEYFRPVERDQVNAALCAILLGEIRAARGQYADAEHYWTDALDILIGHAMTGRAADVHDRLADHYAGRGQTAAAEEHRTAARRLRTPDQ